MAVVCVKSLLVHCEVKHNSQPWLVDWAACSCPNMVSGRLFTLKGVLVMMLTEWRTASQKEIVELRKEAAALVVQEGRELLPYCGIGEGRKVWSGEETLEYLSSTC